MNQDNDKREWPASIGDPRSLPTEMDPPQHLEERVVNALLERGLINRRGPATRQSPGWQAVRASLAAAACVALVAIGVVIGRSTIPDVPGTLTGAETDLYALLLYETPSYDPPTGAEAMQRYGEYGQWIAWASEREQFVTGEDLEVYRGWLLSPADGDVSVAETVAVDDAPPLSGVLFVRADNPEHAIEVARSLPHIRHGGSVVVQKTIRTDIPPSEG